MRNPLQHEVTPSGHVVETYNLDTLGCPFEVILKDSVRVVCDEISGKERVQIPDLMGLMGAVVRARALHSRKLNCAELKFIRKSLGVKSKSLAAHLEITAEHYSRCETGQKPMSSTDEKIFRLFSYLATFYSNPQELLEKMGEEVEPERNSNSPTESDFPTPVRRIIGMKIQSVYDSNDRLCFEFKLCRKENSSDDDLWLQKENVAA